MRNLLKIILLSGIVPLIMITTGCKKENDPETPAANVRLKSTYYYFIGQPTQKLILENTYSGDLLTEINQFHDYGTGTPVHETKTVYIYSGNVIKLYFYFISSTNDILRYSQTFETDNNRIISSTYQPISDSVSEAAQKTVYEYTGSQLNLETKYLRWPGSAWEIWGKNEYVYSAGRLDTILEYSQNKSRGWSVTGKLVFEYLNGKIADLVHYTGNSGTFIIDYTRPYTYSGNLITSIGTAFSGPETFLYDNTGNLVSLSDGNQYFDPKTFQYEPGTGNVAFLNYLENPVYRPENHPMVTCIH
jgi:hypothetical protein